MPDWLWIQNVVFPILGMGMATYFGTLVFRTIHKVIDRRAAGTVSATELAELRAMIEDLQSEVREELTEVHERLDFAERALTSGNPAGPPRDPRVS